MRTRTPPSAFSRNTLCTPASSSEEEPAVDQDPDLRVGRLEEVAPHLGRHGPPMWIDVDDLALGGIGDLATRQRIGPQIRLIDPEVSGDGVPMPAGTASGW